MVLVNVILAVLISGFSALVVKKGYIKLSRTSTKGQKIKSPKQVGIVTITSFVIVLLVLLVLQFSPGLSLALGVVDALLLIGISK